MSNCSSYRVQIASIMEALSKKAAIEISKLFDDGSVALRLEMLKSKRENEALRRKLQVMEVELRAARGYGGEALESSVNISLELEVYDELREAPCPGKEGRPTTEAVINKRWGINQPGGVGDVLTTDEGLWSLPTKIKCESADMEHDWSEHMPIDDGRREEDLDSRPSQVEPEINCGSKWGCPSYTVSGPGRGPLSGPPSCEEELHPQLSPAGGAGQQERGFRPVLKEELEGERPAQSSSPPGEPTVGLELACVWSEATGAGPTQVTVSGIEVGRCGGNTEHGGDEQAEQHLPPLQGTVPLAAFCGTGRGLRPHLQQQQNGLSTVDRHTQGLANVAAAELEAAPCSLGESCRSAQNNDHPTSLMVTMSRQRTAVQSEFICRSCGKVCEDAVQLQRHETCHNVENRLSCKDCGKSFTYLSFLERHERIHLTAKPYTCAQCGKHFRYKGYLKIHQRVHTRERPYACEHCGKCFSQTSNLRTHQIIHTEQKAHHHAECSKTSSDLHILKGYQSSHAMDNSQSVKVRGNGFDSGGSLKQHTVAHRGAKRFNCSLCGKGFSAKSSLKAHQIVHSGEKPFLCNECGKSFSLLCNLKTHLRVHTGEKPFTCKLCSRSFSQNHVLQKHIRTHSEIK